MSSRSIRLTIWPCISICCFILGWFSARRFESLPSQRSKPSVKGTIPAEIRRSPNAAIVGRPFVRTAEMNKERILQQQYQDANTLERNTAAFALLDYYAVHDPAAGIRWLQSLDVLDKPEGLFAVFGSILIRTNETGFFDQLEQLAESSCFEHYLTGGLRSIARKDALRAWDIMTENLSLVRSPEAFRKTTLLNLAQDNADQAITLVDLNESPDKCLEFFSRAVFRDQTIAVSSIASITDPETRGTALHSCIRGAMTDEVAELGDVLLQSDIDPVTRDEGLASASDRLFPDNIAAAIRFSKGIADETLRRETQRKITDYARHRSPEFYQETMKLMNP